MSDRLRSQAQRARLANLLATTPDALTMLEGLDPESLAELADQITGSLFDTSGDRLGGVRRAANLLPPAMAATIGERAMGPVLCALLVGAVDDERLVTIARRLSVPFLAEVAVHIDPRRVPGVVQALAADTIVGVARELVEAGEFATMALFLAYLTDDALVAAVDAIDAESLLFTAAASTTKGRVDQVASGLGEDRIAAILEVAARRSAWLEALSLIDALSVDQRSRVAQVAFGLEEEIFAGLLRGAHEEAVWPTVLPMIGAATDEDASRLATLDLLEDPDVVAALADAAEASHRWPDLFGLLPHLQAPASDHLVTAIESLDPAARHRLIVAATRAGHGPDVARLLGRLPDDQRDDLLDAELRHTARDRTWPDLLALIAALPEVAQDRLAAQAEALSDRDLSAFVRAVDGAELWDPALHLLTGWASTTQDRLLKPVGRLSKRTRTALGARVDDLDIRAGLGTLGDLLHPDEDETD